jgi:hypothetical protein
LLRASRKEELVSLYETHIAPVDREAGDFSSDDEVIYFFYEAV